MLMGFSGRFLAPDFESDAAVGEDEDGQREAVLQEQKDGRVLRLLHRIGPHFGADVAVGANVPIAVLRDDELRHQEQRHGRRNGRQPNGHDDPLENVIPNDIQ